MAFSLSNSFDEIFSQLALRDPHGSPPRKILFWGEGVGEISSYAAGWMAGEGIDVIVLDGANRFDPYMVSTFAKRASISPEDLLKRIRIARAFTCYQMTALVEEKLISLLKKEEGAVQSPPLRVILLGPVSTFLDEDVAEREVRPLFERLLRKVEEMAKGGVPFFFFQPSIPSASRAYLARRLFQISDRVWKISLEEEGAKLVLEKELTKIADCRLRIAE